MRQKPGSAKGVIFMTIEDESGTGDVVIYLSVYETHRRLILGADMIAAEDHINRHGAEATIIVRRLYDLSNKLSSIGKVCRSFPLPYGGGGSCDTRHSEPMAKPRDIFLPDLHVDSIKVKHETSDNPKNVLI